MPPRKKDPEIDLSDDVSTTTVGQTLKLIHKEIKGIGSSKLATEQLSKELKSVKAQVNDQGKSLSVVVASSENLNKTLNDFISLLKELQEEDRAFKKDYQAQQAKHWSNQDATNDKISRLLEEQNETKAELKEIRDRQVKGCPFTSNLKAAIELEFKHSNSEIETVKKATEKNREEIKVLQSDCSVHKEKISVSNNRTDDLEKYQEANEKWKNGLYTWLITGAVTSMAGLLGIIYANLK